MFKWLQLTHSPFSLHSQNQQTNKPKNENWVTCTHTYTFQSPILFIPEKSNVNHICILFSCHVFGVIFSLVIHYYLCLFACSTFSSYFCYFNHFTIYPTPILLAQKSWQFLFHYRQQFIHIGVIHGKLHLATHHAFRSFNKLQFIKTRNASSMNANFDICIHDVRVSKMIGKSKWKIAKNICQYFIPFWFSFT